MRLVVTTLMMLSSILLFSQFQILLQEDFNNGFPNGWQSIPVQGNNQWFTDFDPQETIDGSDLMRINAQPGQNSVTELLLPPLPGLEPGINTVFMIFDLSQVSDDQTRLKVIQIDDQNPNNPIELVQLELTTCELPWSCNNNEFPQIIVELPGFNPSHQLFFVFEAFSQLPLQHVAFDNVAIVGVQGDCPLVLQEITAIPPLCHDLLGSLEVHAVFGTPPYMYSIDGGPPQLSNIFNVPAGDYSIQVVDVEGCIVSGAKSMIAPDALGLTETLTLPPCPFVALGAIELHPSGGTGEYQFRLNSFGAFQDSNLFEDLIADDYIVEVRDENGCIFSKTITLPSGGGFSLNVSQTDPGCNGEATGQITVTGEGGVPPYSYSLNGGAGQDPGVWIDLLAGDHTVVVTDAAGCVETYSTTLTDPVPIGMLINSITPPTCFNGTDGGFSVLGLNGSGTYVYFLDGNINPDPSGIYTNLSAGDHTIIIMDEDECTGNFIITIPNTPDMAIDFVHTALLLCFNDADGLLSVNGVTNGIGPFVYELDGVAGGPTWNNLTAGDYSLKVTDSRPCSKTVTFTVDEPEELGIASIPFDITCAAAEDGIIEVNVGGGTPPYETAIQLGPWLPGGSRDYTDLPSDIYTIFARDANLCTASVGEFIFEPTALISDTASVTRACEEDGEIDLDTGGGTLPYFYEWSNEETTQDLIELEANEYWVITTDANSCITDTLFVIVPYVQGCDPCPEDLNGDGMIDVFDFLDFNSAYGQLCNGCAADMNGDGVVDVLDFLQLNSAYGSVCPTTLLSTDKQLNSPPKRVKNHLR